MINSYGGELNEANIATGTNAVDTDEKMGKRAKIHFYIDSDIQGEKISVAYRYRSA